MATIDGKKKVGRKRLSEQGSQRISFRVPGDLLKEIDEKAKKRGIDRSSLIRMMLSYLIRKDFSG